MADLQELKELNDGSQVDVKTGELVEETTLVRTDNDNMMELIREAERPVFKALAGMASLDWRALSPPHTAILLMSKPFPVSGGGTSYLTFKQALLYAVRAHELQLSPFSDNLWFDPARASVNITMSGKRELARLRNIDMGPPSFEETSREWSTLPKLTTAAEEAKKLGFTRDVGSKCTIRVGPVANNEHIAYTAWLSDWYQPKSPVWREKYWHMLNIRSNEKALTLILGTGASQMPDEKELD